MDLLPVFEWLEDTTIGVVIRDSLWLFPVIEAVHLLALALIGGTILIVDLRLLGFGIRSQSSAALARSLHPWLVGGLFTMVATGVPMFLSEAIKCYYSPAVLVQDGLLRGGTGLHIHGAQTGGCGGCGSVRSGMGSAHSVSFARPVVLRRVLGSLDCVLLIGG